MSDRPTAELEPGYFGPGSRLFGCYHPPQGGARAAAVVLCAPVGEEYIRVHRTGRQLATHLARRGFGVLRFDFSGCGDAAGACEEGRVGRWLADVAAAIAEVRRRRPGAPLGLVGLRLGGTLAALHAAGRGDVEGLVLWDPVLRGKAYLDELAALHEAECGPAQDEALGFPLPEALRADLAALDLLALTRPPARRVLVVESAPGEGGALAAHLGRLGAQADHQHRPAPRVWLKEHKTVVPHQVLQAIVAWLEGALP